MDFIVHANNFFCKETTSLLMKEDQKKPTRHPNYYETITGNREILIDADRVKDINSKIIYTLSWI